MQLTFVKLSYSAAKICSTIHAQKGWEMYESATFVTLYYNA